MANSLNHTRRLVVVLILSGFLNVFLLTLIFYWIQQENQLASYCSLSPSTEQFQQPPLITTHHRNSEVIRHFRTQSFAQLKANLANKELVEEGYTQRDLALAALVAFHHFDVDRALSACPPVQQRRLAYGKYSDGRVAEAIVYPGLSEKQYASIVDFAATERWPLTTRGLFLALKRGKEDPFLADAFYMTQEFIAVEALFGTCSIVPERHELLEALLQGEWSMFAGLFGHQRVLHDLSITKRQGFLMDYIIHGSKAAAYLMLKSDGDFALRRLDDGQVIKLLQLLDTQRVESERFALGLLTSSRTDAVWKEAARCLYRYAGEIMPENCHHHAALARFIPQYAPVSIAESVFKESNFKGPEAPVTPPIVAQPVVLAQAASSTPKGSFKLPKMQTPGSVISGSKEKDSLYIVQEGDSLWKISRRFNVDIDCLKSHNRLDSDMLRTGKPLRIPKR
jgi:LysM repeat protein